MAQIIGFIKQMIRLMIGGGSLVVIFEAKDRYGNWAAFGAFIACMSVLFGLEQLWALLLKTIRNKTVASRIIHCLDQNKVGPSEYIGAHILVSTLSNEGYTEEMITKGLKELISAGVIYIYEETNIVRR